MAVPEPIGPKKTDLPSVPEAKLTPIQVMAAQLLGRGYSRAQVAERLVDYIITKSRRDRSTRLRMCRNRIRKWEKTQDFRDALWDTAVIQLDLDSPAILAGISRKARAGRVDAAKLAFEVTGRHDPKGDHGLTHVEVSFNGIPRPERDHRERRTAEINDRLEEDEDVVEGEYEEVD
jgi:hypothetical protein